MLLSITLAVNIVALAAALWLGLYLISRSPRSLVAWLSGLTLWSVGGLMPNILLALSPQPLPAGAPAWVPLLPFWGQWGCCRGTEVWLGYGVGRCRALVEGQVIRRDLVHNAVAMGLVTSLYRLVKRLSVRVYRVPAAASTFVLMLAVVTHSLVDVTR